MYVMNVIVSTDGSNSIANELEKLQSCIKSSTCLCVVCNSWLIILLGDYVPNLPGPLLTDRG